MANLSRPTSQSRETAPNPSELRNMLGENLRILCQDAPSISALCRELGINRTQFNRYLSGESFPRPDVLHRICQFFDVDARILLEPVADMRQDESDVLHHPDLKEFVGSGFTKLSEDEFPSGFYRFSRQSFVDDGSYVQGMIYVYRAANYALLRGMEPKAAMAQQGLPLDVRAREYRGFLLPQEGGIAALVSRRNAMTCSFNFLARVPSFENNYWEGYAARTVREGVSGLRVSRLVYEHLGRKMGPALEAARATGFCQLDDLRPYHKTLLRAGQPFR
ncbi:helix-turn-helix domain-containing protein [Pseudaestuariivita atlantica]|uniref:XRE family transcriptional regulator n=1 Tax=Pseudaestuariivita atlantica TaxID=1317121 RepID=A0A0L1JQR8_9RHOB|nr:helix-turn-helix transcriptional regulator [Pseudaestuariivita atlantica]KNG94057.1 XRE family transcriptional regulator [Pseudaestuariivita atlantica]